MKISTKGRYGTRALLELALRDTNEPMLLRNIAKKQDISLAYLEHVISPLIAGGILRSTKGPKGGISLNRKPSDIKLSEVSACWKVRWRRPTVWITRISVTAPIPASPVMSGAN